VTIRSSFLRAVRTCLVDIDNSLKII